MSISCICCIARPDDIYSVGSMCVEMLRIQHRKCGELVPLVGPLLEENSRSMITAGMKLTVKFLRVLMIDREFTVLER